MSVKLKQENKHAIYYCTFTCYKWLPLLEVTNLYDHVYKWFKYLKEKDINVIGYVIMPNHIHLILFIPTLGPEISKVIGNAKRFMAYEIIKRLSRQREVNLLSILQQGVSGQEKAKGKKHQVFEPSFDVKECFTEKFIEQKLDYIHHNPVTGKWNLVQNFLDYPYSSISFYEKNEHQYCEISHYKDVGN